jgi:uncharacterized protein (TIGR02117 family)
MLSCSACQMIPVVSNSKKSVVSDHDYQVLVIRKGWHTGIVLNAEDVVRRFPVLHYVTRDVKQVEFGWGDATYYMAVTATTSMLLKAALLPTDAIVRVQGVDGSGYDKTWKLCLNEAQYRALLGFIDVSFKRSRAGLMHMLHYRKQDKLAFYRARGKYGLLNTCNNWTARALRSAGLDIGVVMKQRAGSIAGWLDRNKSCALK